MILTSVMFCCVLARYFVVVAKLKARAIKAENEAARTLSIEEALNKLKDTLINIESYEAASQINSLISIHRKSLKYGYTDRLIVSEIITFLEEHIKEYNDEVVIPTGRVLEEWIRD